MNQTMPGFTLIEILFVIALMGSLFVFLLPSYLDFNDRELARSEARTLADGIRRTFEYATGGVQNDSSHTLFYQFSLIHNEADPAGEYRGYAINTLDSSKSVQTSDLDKNEFSCNVCLTGSENLVNVRVPSGIIEDVSSFPVTYSVCFPGQGSYGVTLNRSGGVTLRGFSENTCSCNLLGC